MFDHLASENLATDSSSSLTTTFRDEELISNFNEPINTAIN